MKITIEESIYLHFTDNCFIHTINEWKQITGKYNWYTFTGVHLSTENDAYTGGFEIECIILGLGLRFRWNYDKSKLEEICKK